MALSLRRLLPDQNPDLQEGSLQGRHESGLPARHQVFIGAQNRAPVESKSYLYAAKITYCDWWLLLSPLPQAWEEL